MSDKIKIDYLHNTEYSNEALNAVGATTSTTLRTVTAYNDANCLHVRKFGTDYAIGDITDAVLNNPRSDGGGVNEWTYEFFGWNGTAWASMGSVQDSTGASQAFSDGAAFAATKVKIVITCDGGAVTITDGDTLTLTTDTDAGGLTVMLSGEGNTYTFDAAWGTLTLYLADSGATYYDAAYRTGGKRVAQASMGTARQPFNSLSTALSDPNATGFTICTVLDSDWHNLDSENMATAWTIQTALGVISTICMPIGASEYRDMMHDGNNDDTVYISSDGSDVTGDGTYQKPYALHSTAFTNRGTRTYGNTMDSGTYNENFTINASFYMEPIWAMTPTITYASSVSYNITVTIASDLWSISGYTFQGDNIISFGIYYNNSTNDCNSVVRNCSFYNYYDAGLHIYAGRLLGLASRIMYNYCSSCGNGAQSGTSSGGITLRLTGSSGSSGEAFIKNNTCRSCCYGILYYTENPGAARLHLVGISNNTIIQCYDGIYVVMAVNNDFQYDLENNTCWDCSDLGLTVTINAAAFTGNVRNFIAIDSLYDIVRGGATAKTITNSTYYVNSGFTIGASCFTTNPELAQVTTPYKLGISTLRRALDGTNNPYHTGTSSNSMGVVTHNVLCATNAIKFNGFIFDGLDQYVHAIYCLATRTGVSLKWCTFKNYIGIAVDGYATGATSWTIANCIFKDNGQAVALPYGSNNITECLFFNNVKIGAWLNYTSNTINHVVIYGADYNIYFDGNSGGNILKNSIIFTSGVYDIYSETAMTITYCCVPGATNNVDLSDASNTTDNPLFVDATGEDFAIKVKESGYLLDSPCKDAADDGYDMGCYLIDKSVSQDSWKSYTVAHNPRTMNEILRLAGKMSYEDADGRMYGWGKAHRVVLPLQWASNSATTEAQHKMLRYICSLTPTRQNGLTTAQCKKRIHLLPDTYYGTGTATVDASALTITDSTKAWYANEKLQWYCTIVFESQAATINATTKVVTAAAATWTNDEWIGYYMFYNNNYYYILDNDGTTITVSDPDDTLTSVSITLRITKFFQIQSNTATALTVSDPNAGLISGSYTYYIDFIEGTFEPDDWTSAQSIYKYLEWRTKADYGFTFISS